MRAIGQDLPFPDNQRTATVQHFRHSDILIFAPTRWKLRRAVKTLNETFTALKLEKHPNKTFIGRIEKGFDFLGYQFGPNGLSVAKKTVENFVAHLHRLYEQKKTAPDREAVLGDYVRRWRGWVQAGLGDGMRALSFNTTPSTMTGGMIEAQRLWPGLAPYHAKHTKTKE